MLSRERAGKESSSEEENAVIAIEIAHGLLMKDRMDARQLGLESLCLLTDPQKTGAMTALIASRVVLLGTTHSEDIEDEAVIYDEAPFQEIRETILSIVQFRRIGDESEFAYDEPDSDDETFGGAKPSDDNEYINILHNLALAVLANALDVIEKLEQFDETPEETERKPAARGFLVKRTAVTFHFP
jgi:hypothetical protein